MLPISTYSHGSRSSRIINALAGKESLGEISFSAILMRTRISITQFETNNHAFRMKKDEEKEEKMEEEEEEEEVRGRI